MACQGPCAEGGQVAEAKRSWHGLITYWERYDGSIPPAPHGEDQAHDYPNDAQLPGVLHGIKHGISGLWGGCRPWPLCLPWGLLTNAPCADVGRYAFTLGPVRGVMRQGMIPKVCAGRPGR